MGVSEFFHFESECEKCGEKCHFVMQAKLPGSYMNDYGIGDRLADEVLEAFKKGEREYYSKVLGVEKDKVIKPKDGLPSFTILPTHVDSHCKICGRNDVERSISVVIEEGVFAQVLYDAQRKGSIMHGGLVIPELVLENDELRSQLLEAAKEYYEGPTEEPKPCPYCGKPLRTSLAKQCLECHMDWHDPNNVIKHKVDENKSIDKKEDVNDKDADEAIRRALGIDD